MWIPCRVHNSTPVVPVPIQINLVHAFPFCLISILISYSNLCLSFPSNFFASGFPTKILCTFLFPPYVPHAQYISSVWIWSPKQQLVVYHNVLHILLKIYLSMQTVKWNESQIITNSRKYVLYCRFTTVNAYVSAVNKYKRTQNRKLLLFKMCLRFLL